MTIKLVALDLDDTLLDDGLNISPVCRRTIQAVRSRGVRITISTGRMFKSALPYAEQLDIDVPLITYQGAWVKSSRSGEVLYHKPVPTDLTREIIDYFQTQGIHVHSYYNDHLVMEKLTPEGEAYAALAGVQIRLVDSMTAELERAEAMKIMAISHHETQLLLMQDYLQRIYQSRLHITRSKPYFLEVMHPEADKARALQVIASHFKLDRDEVMAVGDSFNDLEMIKWAGLGVAMGNAVPVVKAAADYITKSNEEEGVAEALQRFILRN